MDIKLIDEAGVASVLNPSNCFLAVKDVFVSMEGSARNFPVIRESLGYEDAIYGFKSGFDPSSGALGLKSGGYWPHNEKKSLANHQSTIFMFNPDTGQCMAALSANLITALRTAAAAAVSIDTLSRVNSKALALIGTGHQSKFQLEAALRVRNFETVYLWNRSNRNVSEHKAIALKYGAKLVETDIETAVTSSDVVITILSSSESVIDEAWIRPGTHLTCMGTDTKGKQEIDPKICARSKLFTDEIPQSQSIGEFQHIDPSCPITTLGAVLNNSAQGRSDDSEITVFDGTGVGLQDLACARLVLARLIGN